MRARILAAALAVVLGASARADAPVSKTGIGADASHLADGPGPGDPLAGADGATIYRDICQGCHMRNGQGAVGAGVIPSLAGNPKVGSGAYVAMVLTHGLGGMPAVGETMTDAQVIRVIAYVQSHFGNHANDPPAASLVHAMRTPQTPEKWAD